MLSNPDLKKTFKKLLFFQPEHGYLKSEVRDYINNIINWAIGKEIWVTLTMTYNGGTIHENFPYNQTNCIPFVSDQNWKNEFYSMWQYLVRKYLTTPFIAFIEPYAEPSMNGCTSVNQLTFFFCFFLKLHILPPPRRPKRKKRIDHVQKKK